MNPDLPIGRFDEPVSAHTRVGSARSIRQILDSLGSSSRYERDQEVYREESPIGCWYRLISGAARRYAVRPDGRRQIVDVLLPGDMFGFGNRGKHAFSAEAIADGTVIARYPLARGQSEMDRWREAAWLQGCVGTRGDSGLSVWLRRHGAGCIESSVRACRRCLRQRRRHARVHAAA